MLILFIGPSGSGKTTLLNALVSRYQGFKIAVRVTTRKKRSNEQNGVDYYFVTKNRFIDMKEDGALLEVEEYSGDRFYGTPWNEFLDFYSNVCSTITPSGLLQIVNSGVDFGNILVVYCTCDLKTQISRYTNRVDEFTVDDKMEMCDRIARDEGMFKGINAILHAASDLYSLKLEKFEDVKRTIRVTCVDTTKSLDSCLDMIVGNIKICLGQEILIK